MNGLAKGVREQANKLLSAAAQRAEKGEKILGVDENCRQLEPSKAKHFPVWLECIPSVLNKFSNCHGEKEQECTWPIPLRF
jgi:hypothetical protein